MANLYREGKGSWFKPLLILLLFVFAVSVFSFGEENSAAPAPAPSPAQESGFKKFVKSDYLTGDWGGARTKLAEEKGISFNLFNHTDMMGAVSGGNGQGFGIWNRIRGTVNVDMGKLAHIKGLSLMMTGTWNNGSDPGFDPRYLGALTVVTGNDTGIHQVRLDQWWVQQDLFNNKLSFRFGQLGAETYFGWMPSGFNHFMSEPLFYSPLGVWNAYLKPDIHNSSMGGMVTIAPNKHFTYKTGVVSINLHPTANGWEPTFKDGVSWINDFGFRYALPEKNAVVKDYSGEFHFGFSYTGVANSKFSVVKPGITSAGNAGYYTNIIQPVFRVKPGSNRGLDVRGRFVWGPETKGLLPWNRQITLSAIFNGPIPSRPKDSINVGFNQYLIRSYLNTPENLVAGLPVNSEKGYEFNYSMWATNWWNLMPTVWVGQDLGANPQRGTGVMVGVRSFINF